MELDLDKMIEILQGIRKEHGNLPVYATTWTYDPIYTDSITVKEASGEGNKSVPKRVDIFVGD